MADESKTSTAAATGAGAPNTPFAERSLAGRHILLTGGSRGIGRELARQLALRGAKVIICGRSEAAAVATAAQLTEAAAKEAADKAGSVEGVGCDIGDLTSVKALVAHIKAKYTYLDVVINNASIMPGYSEDPETVPDELEAAAFQINVVGSHFVTKLSLPLLWAQPDPEEFARTVLFTTSSAAWLTEPDPGYGMLCYRATKAAQHGSMVGLAQAYCPPASEDLFGFRTDDNKQLGRVAAAHPGFVQTGLGIESAGGMAKDAADYAKKKVGFGAIPVEQGADTLLWLTAAADGVTNGKQYYLRAEHSF